MNYEECVKYLLDIPKFSSKNTLEDTRAFLDKVYEDGSCKIIHIAGTNGKGSTSEYIYSILRNSGFSVGLFTSPHLVKVNERISVNGKDITDEELTEVFEDIYKLTSKEGFKHHPSFFEFLFLMGMRYFSLHNVDYIVLETGLGGRLDATNCVRSKALSVITNIGLDHMEYLGNTITEIAYEKAGIISKNTPVCFFDERTEVSKVIGEVSSKQNSECYSIKNDSITINAIGVEGIDFSVNCDYYKYDALRMPTSASYQTRNASLAILAVNLLKEKNITSETVREGLKMAFWPGRMEEILPGIYLDGAHNEHGIRAFLSSVRNMPSVSKRHLFFSVVSDKQYRDMIKMIVDSGLFADYYVAPIASVRSLSKDDLTSLFSEFKGIELKIFENVEDAFNNIVDDRGEDEEVFVVGSLYLVGQIKSILV